MLIERKLDALSAMAIKLPAAELRAGKAAVA